MHGVYFVSIVKTQHVHEFQRMGLYSAYLQLRCLHYQVVFTSSWQLSLKLTSIIYTRITGLSFRIVIISQKKVFGRDCIIDFCNCHHAIRTCKCLIHGHKSSGHYTACKNSQHVYSTLIPPASMVTLLTHVAVVHAMFAYVANHSTQHTISKVLFFHYQTHQRQEFITHYKLSPTVINIQKPVL